MTLRSSASGLGFVLDGMAVLPILAGIVWLRLTPPRPDAVPQAALRES